VSQLAIEIPEANVNRVINMLCKYGGLEPSNALNAKIVVASLIRQAVEVQEKRVAEAKAEAERLPPVEGMT
jgi:hypothetical protein